MNFYRNHRTFQSITRISQTKSKKLILPESSSKRWFTQPTPPHPSSFFKRGDKVPRGGKIETLSLTELRFDSADNLKKQAYEMYERSKLSNREPTTRFAIVRQMRNLDLPPHQKLWQSIEVEDELRLFRWVDEAFGQLLYQKRLWRPSQDWSPEDDRSEAEQRDQNLKILREAYEDQILRPLKDQYGDDEVTVAISKLDKDQQLYCEPALIWQSTDPESGEVELEWMSEYTADVAWPGLVGCKAEHQIARRHWESEAREFVRLTGGIAMGLGENGEQLPMETEEEKMERLKLMNKTFNNDINSDQNNHGFSNNPNHRSGEMKHISENILIKKFLSERSNGKFYTKNLKK